MIVHLPSELQADELSCAICRVQLSLARATAGLFDANNQQAFACISHLFEVEKLISGWADFMAQERIKHLKQDQKPIHLLYGESG